MEALYLFYASIVFVAAVVAAALTMYAWRRRDAPAVAAFVWLMAATTGWATSNGARMISATPAAAIFWFRCVLSCIAVTPVLLLIFVVNYTGREKWLNPRRIALLFIVPILTLILNWTDSWHGLFIHNVTFMPITSFWAVAGWDAGLWFVAHTVYGYLLIAVSVALIVLTILRATQPYRAQAVFLLVGVLMPLTANVLVTFRLVPTTFNHITSVSFVAMGLVFAWAIFRYRFLDLMPMARDRVVDTMREAFMVLDRQDRLVDLNPAAQAIVGLTLSEAVGRPVAEALAPWQALVERFQPAAEAQAEIALERAGAQRYYDLRVSPLADKQGRVSGRLFFCTILPSACRRRPPNRPLCSER